MVQCVWQTSTIKIKKHRRPYQRKAKKTPKKALKSSNGFNMDNRSNDETDNSKNQLISDLQRQITNLKAEKASIESGFQIELERHKRNADEYQQECKDLRKKVDDLKSDNKAAENEKDTSIKELKDKLDRVVSERKNIETVQFNLKKEKARADGFEKECKELREKLLEGEESVRSAERHKEEMNNSLKSATDKKKELIQENLQYKKTISDLQGEISNLEKKVKIRDSAKRNLQNDNKKMEQEHNAEKESLRQRTKEIEEELQAKNVITEEQKKQISELKNAVNEKMKEINQLNEKYNDFEMKTNSKLSDIESERVRQVKKDMLDEILELKNKHRVAVEVADAKRLQLEKEIQDSKIMSGKATETLESRISSMKNKLLEVEEERNAKKRELQEVSERLAVVESMRNADHEECVQQRRVVLQVKEENENLRRELVNSKNEETLMKLRRELEDTKSEKIQLESTNKELTLKLENSKIKFKAMIETAMRRAATEASQDTASEWQKRVDQDTLSQSKLFMSCRCK